jgi:hypothetical protein
MQVRALAAWIIFFVFTVNPRPSGAEESEGVGNITANELAAAIDAWSGEAQWWECGAPVKTRRERSMEYAQRFVKASEINGVSSLMLAAVVEQESGYDECQVGKRTRDLVGLPMHPTYEGVAAELGTREKRRAYGISYFDAGAAQFLWPRASSFNATDGVPLRDVMSSEWSISTLGITLGMYRKNALATRPNGYTFRTNKGRSVHVSAEAGFVIHHNSPDASNHRYFWSVRSRGVRLLKVIQDLRAGQKAASALFRPIFPHS